MKWYFPSEEFTFRYFSHKSLSLSLCLPSFFLFWAPIEQPLLYFKQINSIQKKNKLWREPTGQDIRAAAEQKGGRIRVSIRPGCQSNWFLTMATVCVTFSLFHVAPSISPCENPHIFESIRHSSGEAKSLTRSAAESVCTSRSARAFTDTWLERFLIPSSLSVFSLLSCLFFRWKYNK